MRFVAHLFLLALAGIGLALLADMRRDAKATFLGAPATEPAPARVGHLPASPPLQRATMANDPSKETWFAVPPGATAGQYDPQVIANTVANELDDLGDDTGARRLRSPSHRPDIGANFVSPAKP